jgi:hypothetical protein
MERCIYNSYKACDDDICNPLCPIYIEHCSTKNDTINHPSHYTDGKIETIDYIEDKKLNYHLGNAVKYISRAGKKDPAKYAEDLKKAVWYINREIERVK